MAVGHEDIEPAVEVGIDDSNSEPNVGQRSGTEAVCETGLHEQSVAIISVTGVGLGFQIGNKDLFIPIPIEIRCIHTHPRLSLRTFSVGTSCEQGIIFEEDPALLLPLVDQQKVGLAIVGHIQVRVSIVFDVDADDTQCLCRKIVQSAALTDIGELATAIIEQ